MRAAFCIGRHGCRHEPEGSTHHREEGAGLGVKYVFTAKNMSEWEKRKTNFQKKYESVRRRKNGNIDCLLYNYDGGYGIIYEKE